jgi:hypothetical protein
MTWHVVLSQLREKHPDADRSELVALVKAELLAGVPGNLDELNGMIEAFVEENAANE